jgi:hypothetical protein
VLIEKLFNRQGEQASSMRVQRKLSDADDCAKHSSQAFHVPDHSSR